MKPKLPSSSDPLLRLLDEWQSVPDVPAGFDLELRRRIAAAPARQAWWWRRLPAAGLRPGWAPALGGVALLIVVGIFFFLRTMSPANAGDPPGIQMARFDPVVRDLQTWDSDRELLENLDFLSASSENLAPARPRVQDRD